MQLVILWTDYFVYLLLAITLIYILKARRDPVTRERWGKLFSRPINLVSVMILMVYVTLGVLDSIHWKEQDLGTKLNASGIISALDRMLLPLASQKERTYSAPFALYGFTKEASLNKDGKIIREYPRLMYAGKNLSHPDEKIHDINRRLAYVALGGTIIWCALSIIILLYARIGTGRNWEEFFDEVLRGKRQFPWRSFLITLWVMILIVVFVRIFMPYYHILGTNQIGEDVFYQTLKSIRTGLIIGTLTTLVTLPFAIFFGIVAGYFRGWADDLIQYIYTTLSAIPGVLLIAAAVLVMQMVMDTHTDWFETTVQRADVRLLILCLILGITSWTSLCRLLRAEALKLSQMDYVQAAHTLGVTDFKILLRHMIPNVMHIILITVALDFSGLVLAEAVLTYVGVGVDPTTYSWGMMINSARLELAREPVVWWCLAAAFIFMFVLVLVANIFSDAIRDMFDPYYFKGTS